MPTAPAASLTELEDQIVPPSNLLQQRIVERLRPAAGRSFIREYSSAAEIR